MGPLRMLLLAAVAVLIVASPAGASPYDITIEKSAAPAESAAAGSGSLGRNSQTPASMRTNDASGAGDIAPRIPQRAVASGTCTVAGIVLDYAGSPVGGTDIELSYRGATGSYTGYTMATTAPDGTFSFSDVPLTSAGRLWTWRSGMEYRRHNLVFGPGTNYYALRPGQVLIQATRSADPSWADWESMWVECYGGKGTADREVVGTSGYAYAMEPSFNYIVVNFWANEAAEGELLNPLPVTAGAISQWPINVDEDVARRIRV
ncbi:MAG TPA: carboxypeptidase-like regulatory domain-containing protein, partial [Armatimonadota bacterium]|nr:carboxypeptidase-like regulatory domain-containing protein [Armatimonadota bacterium]